MIVLYHQTKTSINFLCRWRLNPNHLYNFIYFLKNKVKPCINIKTNQLNLCVFSKVCINDYIS